MYTRSWCNSQPHWTCIALRVSEFYSLVSFIRVLMNAKRQLPCCVLQMKWDDFREYHILAKTWTILFSKVVHLKFTQVWHTVQYKPSWLDSDLKAINIHRLAASTRKTCRASEECGTFPSVKTASAVHQLSREKKNDLKSMPKWLPLEDRQYYEKSILKQLITHWSKWQIGVF